MVLYGRRVLNAAEGSSWPDDRRQIVVGNLADQYAANYDRGGGGGGD